MDDFRTGHVPEDLVYGPVASRRFGRSLGVSCSLPGPAACRWHCPYCQLGAHHGDGRDRQAPIADIVAALGEAVRRLPPIAVDAVTVAGNGEPLDHPQFGHVAQAAIDAARQLCAEAVLLTNGDGLARWSDAAERFDRTFVKWDPGPADGAWRSLSATDAERRRRLLRAQDRLRIQAMLYDVDGHDGNDDEARLEAWIRDLRDLRPIEVHLTTIERRPPNQRLRAANRAKLERWRVAAEAALRVPVSVYPAGGDVEVACDRANPVTA